MIFTPLITPLKTWNVGERPETTVDGKGRNTLVNQWILEQHGTVWDVG